MKQLQSYTVKKVIYNNKLCNEKGYTIRLHNCIVIIRQLRRVHYLQTGAHSNITLGCKHPMRLVVAELSLVAPNQRRTETGVGTQSPPRTDYPGPPQEDFGFPRLGWSVLQSRSQNREGLPSPPLERLVAVIYTRVGGPRGPSASCV